MENMPENQKAIYYLASDSLKSAKSAPFVEKLIQKDIEVSFFKGSVALDMVVKMICQEDYC